MKKIFYTFILISPILFLFSCEEDKVEGCTDSQACNFNTEANMTDGLCEYAEPGYDCDGNFIEYILGMEAMGGVVFYIDSTGEHGLVAAIEDIPDTYEWGCYGDHIGTDGISIGTGYQNTLYIINQGCVTENGGITAAQAAIDIELNGYSDWYLPSKDELLEMYDVGYNQEANTCLFSNGTYWSSDERDKWNSWKVLYNDAFPFANGNSSRPKQSLLNIRVIRSF